MSLCEFTALLYFTFYVALELFQLIHDTDELRAEWRNEILNAWRGFVVGDALDDPEFHVFA